MHQPMSSRERLLLTLTVCLALLVVPMTALAATGQLVNIVDPTNVNRAAKVTEVGALQVETRPGIPQNLVHRTVRKAGTGWVNLYQIPDRKPMAYVEFSAANTSTAGAKTVYLTWYSIPSAGSCTSFSVSTATGTSSLRTIIVPNQTTVSLSFGAVPLNIPGAPVGSKTCVGAVVSGPSTGNIELGFSGYTYTP